MPRILFLAILSLTGCGDTTNINPTIVKEASPTGTITGTVMDGNTRLPLEAASLSLVVNGEKRTTESSSALDSDLKGTFAFPGVPAGSHTLRISAPGFAKVQLLINMPPSADNTPITANLGPITLGKAFDIKVITTNIGNIITGVPVFAMPNGRSADCNAFSFFTPNPLFTSTDISDETRSTTDASGIATLSGLSQCDRYLIVAPPYDSNNDGTYDYVATAVVLEGINSEKTISLPLTQAQRDDPISVVATSMDLNKKVAFSLHNISDTGPDPGSDLILVGTGCLSGCSQSPFSIPSSNTNSVIKLVFNYPVSIDGAITVTYSDDLVNPDQDGNDLIDPEFPKTKSLAVTTALDSTGTILTVTPPAGGFPKNETIRIGSITATIKGIPSFFGQDVYIADNTSTGLTASSGITADNYNGSSSSSTLSAVYLEFPEYVRGTYQVISYTTASNVTQGSGDIVPINPDSFSSGTAGEMVYTDGTLAPLCSRCGNGAGIVHRVPLQSPNPFSSALFLADGDKVKLQIDVTDTEGNRFFKEVDLTVQ
jgi:hypothetical protein